MKKVAIIARGPSSSEYPGEEEFDEIWILNAIALFHKGKVDKLFIMDDLKLRMPFYSPDNEKFIEIILRDWTGEVITSHKYEEYPDNIKEFPLHDCVKQFGLIPGTAFYSTTDYMIALAIMEGFNEINLYGVDNNFLPGQGLEQMRSSLALWIGIATGRGVKVTVAAGSFYEYFLHSGVTLEQGLYGYVKRPRLENLISHLIEADGDGVKDHR